MRLNHLLTNVRLFEHFRQWTLSLQNTKINMKEIIQLNRKVALNKKVKYTLSTSRERRGMNPL